MNVKIEYNKKVYEINSNHGKSISIPMNFNSNNNPKFYDESNPTKESYTSNDITYDINKDAGCNVPVVKFNVHCSGTHTETGAHIFKGSQTIGELSNLNFIPSRLITIKPQKQSSENYHVTYDLKDQIISLFTLFPKLKKKGIYVVEELDFPDTRKDMNLKNEKNTLYTILKSIKKNKSFNSQYVSEYKKKYFMKNYKYIKIYKGRFNKIAFIVKK